MARRSHDRWTEAHVKRLFWRARLRRDGEGGALLGRRAPRARRSTGCCAAVSGPPRPRFPKPGSTASRWIRSTSTATDVLWWLDKMVRTPRPLVEKTPLVWHDAVRDAWRQTHDRWTDGSRTSPVLARRLRASSGRLLTDARGGPDDAARPRARPTRGRASPSPRSTASRWIRSTSTARTCSGQDGPHAAPARREDDALLARPLRDARPGPAAADRPEQDAAPRRPGQLPAPADRRHEGPGDAAVPLARRLAQGGAQRELRARAHGALHARQGLHREGHPRGGARAHRLSLQAPRRRQRRGALRRQGARRHRPRRSSASAATSTTATCSTSASPTSSTRRFSSPSCGTTSSARRSSRRRASAWPASTATAAIASRPSCARSSSTPRSIARSTRPTWSSRRSSTSSARCAPRARGSRARTGSTCSTAWASSRSARRRWPAGSGGPRGFRRTRCTCASTAPTSCCRAVARSPTARCRSTTRRARRSPAPAARSGGPGRRRRPTPSCSSSRRSC